MDKIKEEFEKYRNESIFQLVPNDLESFREGYKSRDPEIKKLKRVLKVSMSLLQRESWHMPNYDITESQMWIMFKEALGETDA